VSLEPVIPLAYQAPAHPAVVAPGGLSPEQFQQLADARQRGTKIRRAISVAKFNAWTIAIFAGFTLIGAIFSLWAALLGIGMAIVAYFEFQGAERLRKLDASVAKALAINQVALGVLLLTYAVYSLLTAGREMDEIKNQMASSPEVANFMMSVQGLTQLVTWLIYGTLAAVAIFGQGGTALFYLSRRRYIEEYARQTPQWIIQAQQAGMPM
jgi:hypothetical protein